MSDRMTPIAFDQLVNWMINEHKKGSCFGMRKCFRADKTHTYEIFGRKIETPFGPAAGPHTQLAQNIVASYYGGARFFELKTVQKIDGEDLKVSKPCILAGDEGYNCEWSTELTVKDAFAEYVKAWFILKVFSREWDLGSEDGFQFNMSVGYDLDGIKTDKINDFIEGMKNASDTRIFKECKTWLLENVSLFEKVGKEDIESIDAKICNSVTLSTLHGCPPQEIERIATYLIKEKNLNTFVKCNPTLLGYDFARRTLNAMGYDYIQFTDVHFKGDLQYSDAVPMFKRLETIAGENGLSFGVKLTNTFPVDVKNNELPSEEMYMSGKSLFALSMELVARLSKEFGGKLRIAYSGGCDFFNVKSVVDAGIWPVTMATTLLKNGGYTRFVQIAEMFALKKTEKFTGVDVEKAMRIAEFAGTDTHLLKPVKPLPPRKNNRQVPLYNCFIAPCMETCPIHQDITTYGRLCKEEKYADALRVILTKNPLPFITGNICNHACMAACTRNYYENPVQIRANKLLAAKKGYDEVIREIKPGKSDGKKICIVGAGPAGIAAAYFLALNGCEVKVFDENEEAGGVPANVIPDFRIKKEDIEKDISFAKAAGAQFVMGQRIEDIEKLKKQENADAVILCIGAHKDMPLKLEQGNAKNALEFLAEYKLSGGNQDLGEKVIVIGGGNTAMDAARAAKDNRGVKEVYLVYRRDRRNMPADEEELDEAIEDGVIFKELLSPVSFENGSLLCRKMKLGNIDKTGRRSVEETGESELVPADTVIASIGEKVDSSFYEKNNLEVTDRGFLKVNPETGESSEKGIYAAGDGLAGGSVVVKAIAGAKLVAEAILEKHIGKDISSEADDKLIYEKKGRLDEPEGTGDRPDKRCLTCDRICENCTEVCPNRANISINIPGEKMHQIIHVDYMCNECGNCRTFCPWDSAPYKDKFTLFMSEKDMGESQNDGFVFLGTQGETRVRLGEMELNYTVGKNPGNLGKDLSSVIDTVFKDYSYLIPKSSKNIAIQ